MDLVLYGIIFERDLFINSMFVIQVSKIIIENVESNNMMNFQGVRITV